MRINQLMSKTNKHNANSNRTSSTSWSLSKKPIYKKTKTNSHNSKNSSNPTNSNSTKITKDSTNYKITSN